MTIISNITSWLVRDPSDLQKLEFQLQRLSNRQRMLEQQRRVDRNLELRIAAVHQQIASIHKQRDRIQRENDKLLSEANAELDAEFPLIRSLVERD